MTRTALTTVVLACALFCACDSNKNNSAWSTQPADTAQKATAATSSAAAPAAVATSGKGIGPVDHVDLGSLAESKEPIGAELFQGKCSACHKLDERYIGPALAGITTRRQPEWILNMILNPEVMVQQDPTAKALLAEFIAPMANQHLTREEAECILVYFREHDQELGEDHEEHEEEAEGHESSTHSRAASGH